MGSSSSKSIAQDTSYSHYSWYTGSAKGAVKVWSCRVKRALGLGVHHGIVVHVPSLDKFVVYEWGNDGAEFYACAKIGGQKCMDLGQHTLDEVYNAAWEASNGRSYSTSYNCNHWIETVAYKLGHDITVRWNCSCVL